MRDIQSHDRAPGAYQRFRGLRLQPALDLISAIGPIPDGGVVDLGCGNGVVAEVLQNRWPDQPLFGVDASPAMLDMAR